MSIEGPQTVSAEDLRRLGRNYSTKAGELRAIINFLNSQVGGKIWRGNAAQTLDQLWAQHKNAMTQIANQLDVAGKDMTSRAPAAIEVNRPVKSG